MNRVLGISLGVFVAATLVSGFSFAVQPTGYLDSAGCDVIAGWAQDPDVPTQPIDVHVYFGAPAGTPGTPATAVNASNYRADLCAAIGSCEHGYAVRSPLSLHDGNARDVYAYAIDTGGEGNPLLGNSPRTLTCAPAAQSGVRRKVSGVPTYDAWKFASFWDLLPLPADLADALPDGAPLPDKPEVVRADDGSPEVWLIDSGVRRHVTAEAAANWRIDPAAAEVRPAAEIQGLVEGTPLRARPILFLRGALFLVDDPQPEAPNAMSSSAESTGAWGGEGSGGAGGAGNEASGVSGMCAVGWGRGTGMDWFGWTIAAGAAVLLRRGRRRG